MSYKNSVRLFISNFTLVWKQLLYLLICGAIFAICVYATTLPLISLLRENFIVDEFEVIIQTVYHSPSELALKLSEFLRHILTIIINNFSAIWASLLGLIFLGILLPYILIQMSFYNLASIIQQKITMNMNVNYVQNAVKNLSQSIKYALANLLFNLPFAFLTILFIDVYLIAATTIASSLIGLFFLSLVLIILNSVKISLFTYYVGYMVDNNSGPFVAFGKSIVNVFKNFLKIFSMSIIVSLTLIFVNSFIGVFTFFAGLIVLIPATFVFLAIYYMVVYLNIKGERYYLSNNLIYNPTKYVVKQEDYSLATIPEETKEVTTTKMKKIKNKSKKKTKSKKNIEKE